MSSFRGSVRQCEGWVSSLKRVQKSMESVSEEWGPTKAENLVQYALEEAEADLVRAKAPGIYIEAI